MKSRDQILLEEAYKSVHKRKASSEWGPLPKENNSRKGPCICGSGKPFNKCCGSRIEVGNLVTVMSNEEAHWLDLSNMAPEYKIQWETAVHKVGELIGCKWVKTKEVYKPKESWGPGVNTIKMLLYGIKLLDGKIYAIDRDLVDWPTEEQTTHYNSIKQMETKLPEVAGIF
jgi:hypothetical protein